MRNDYVSFVQQGVALGLFCDPMKERSSALLFLQPCCDFPGSEATCKPLQMIEFVLDSSHDPFHLLPARFFGEPFWGAPVDKNRCPHGYQKGRFGPDSGNRTSFSFSLKVETQLIRSTHQKGIPFSGLSMQRAGGGDSMFAGHMARSETFESKSTLPTCVRIARFVCLCSNAWP